MVDSNLIKKASPPLDAVNPGDILVFLEDFELDFKKGDLFEVKLNPEKNHFEQLYFDFKGGKYYIYRLSCRDGRKSLSHVGLIKPFR